MKARSAGVIVVSSVLLGVATRSQSAPRDSAGDPEWPTVTSQIPGRNLDPTWSGDTEGIAASGDPEFPTSAWPNWSWVSFIAFLL